MAITFPLVTLSDGALISKTFVDAVVDDINHLVDRPNGWDLANASGQTATTTTYTQLSSPSVTITPKRSGYIAIWGAIGLAHNVGGVVSLVRFSVNGFSIGTHACFPTTVGISVPMFAKRLVTADVAYTIKLEFNNDSASGTVTALSTFRNWIYAIEVGAA